MAKVSPEMIEAMEAAGCSAEQIILAVKKLLAKGEERRAEIREQNRIRQQNHRARNAMSRVTERDERDTPLDKEGFPHTPSEEITPPKEKAPKGAKKKGPLEILLGALSEATSRAVIEHRAKLRKPLTDRAAELLVARLHAAPASCGLSPEQAADYMIEKGWQSFEPGWVKGSTPAQTASPVEASDSRWQARLKLARERQQWSSLEWGPRPNSPGCMVPQHLVQPSDGQGWAEFRQEAA